MKRPQKNPTGRCRSPRRGSATVELVAGIPILFLMTFGAIEACNLNHLQQCATETSYQGALTGMAFASSETQVISRMDAMLTAQDITGFELTIEGLDGQSFGQLQSGESFRVTTRIPAAENLPMLAMIITMPDLVSDRVARKP